MHSHLGSHLCDVSHKYINCILDITLPPRWLPRYESIFPTYIMAVTYIMQNAWKLDSYCTLSLHEHHPRHARCQRDGSSMMYVTPMLLLSVYFILFQRQWSVTIVFSTYVFWLVVLSSECLSSECLSSECLSSECLSSECLSSEMNHNRILIQSQWYYDSFLTTSTHQTHITTMTHHNGIT